MVAGRRLQAMMRTSFRLSKSSWRTFRDIDLETAARGSEEAPPKSQLPQVSAEIGELNHLRENLEKETHTYGSMLVSVRAYERRQRTWQQS